MFFWNYGQAFWPSCQKIFNRSAKNIHDMINFSKNFSHKTPFWKNRIQLWQSCWKAFTRSPNKISEPRVFCKRKFSLKLSLRGWRLKLWQNCRKFFTRSSKECSEFTFCSIKSFFPKCSIGKVHCAFDNLAEMFLSEIEN